MGENFTDPRKHVDQNVNVNDQAGPDCLLEGKPVQIVIANEDHTFDLEEEKLRSVLFHDDIRDKKVVVISIAGAFRKGKTFLLNFLLRFLAAKGSPDWLGDDKQKLEGFPWRGGSNRETTGIWMWSKPFICPVPSGEEVAVLLIDTQGMFDSDSTVREGATIFALSTLISSIQVYNLTGNIQENDLQSLEMFAEYGRLASAADDDENSRPFQKLLFLVRDWPYPYEYDYGEQGGKAFLDKKLKTFENQVSELQQTRRHIKGVFENLSGFLMPYPGSKVATKKTFTGNLDEIGTDFKKQLKILVPLLLSEENLIMKKINGRPIVCLELVKYLQRYIRIYQGDELPKPRSIYQATMEANNLSAVSNAKLEYYRAIEKVAGAEKGYIKPDLLENEHNRCKDEAVKSFRKAKKMGAAEYQKQYEDGLIEEIENRYMYLKIHNEHRSRFSVGAVKTFVNKHKRMVMIAGGVVLFAVTAGRV